VAISLASLRRGAVLKPPIILDYGPAGVGKTTLAAGAPNPIFLPVEDGLGMLDVPTFPLLKTFQEVEEAIGSLATEEHDFKTVVLDSADWLERLVWNETCARNGWKTIESPDYGKGYGAALDVWKYLLDGLSILRDENGMAIIILAHASIRKFESPETEPYDRFTPKLHESNKGIGANPLIQEFVDCIFFQNFRATIVKDRGKGDKVGEGHARGVGGNQRVVYTQDRPAAVAKNRYSMPPEIFLPNDPTQAWPTVAQHLPFYNTATTLKDAA
jgi:hypothetical protein